MTTEGFLIALGITIAYCNSYFILAILHSLKEFNKDQYFGKSNENTKKGEYSAH